LHLLSYLHHPNSKIGGTGVGRPPVGKLSDMHVLRARAEAVKALVSFAQLEKGSEEPRVRSSIHLVELNGRDQEGRRYAREVVLFLRQRGARIVGLENSINVEGEWLANPVSSDWEGEASDAGAARDDDVIWVPSSPLGD
jgi:hypothetical protein